MSSEPFRLSVADLSARLEQRELSAVELAQSLLGRIEAVEPTVRAFLSYDANDLLRQAGESDARRARGEARGPLEGIPIGIKDAISVAGQPLTCASKILEKFVSPYDATVTGRLRAAGALPWGRLNLDEFAMGCTTENSAFQTTRNPWNPELIAGGSSGGSAAAVAAGELPVTLGSDTGGSVRQPASVCGVVGLKPTYGRVSRYGLVAFASSLDQIGPLGRRVEDVAMVLQAIAGPDAQDATSYAAPIPDYREAVRKAAGPWRLGVPREYFAEGLDAEVRAAITAAIDFYRAEGCEVIDIALPQTHHAVSVYYIIATAEASANLARFDGVRYTHRSPSASDAVDLYAKSRGEAFGPEVKRRIILGTYVLSSGYYDAWYGRAQKVRTLIRNDFLNALQGVDAILAPTSPTPPFRIGEKIDDPLSMYLSDIYTISANLAGLPAISLPCGFSKDGRPIGLQVVGRPFDEAGVLAVARAYERGHAFADQIPG